MRARSVRARLGALIAAGAAAGTAQAATITVNSLADTTVAGDGQCTLREALANANADSETTGGDCAAGSGADTIQFQSGLTGTIALGGTQLSITDSVTVDGPGAGVLAISAGGLSQILYIRNPSVTLAVTISGLTLKQGTSVFAGAVADYADSLTLSGVTLSENTHATLLAGGGSLTLLNSIVTGNSGFSRGGGLTLNNRGPAVIDHCVISNNTAWYGGGIGISDNFGPVTITNSDITGNGSSTRFGGGIFIENSHAAVTIASSRITGNSAWEKGGGIELFNTGADVTIQDTTISGNTSGTGPGFYANLHNDGGGIFSYYQGPGTTLRISGSTISSNSAENLIRNGGGIFLYASAGATIIEDTTIASNNANRGGGIYDLAIRPTGTLAIRNSTIFYNYAFTESGNLRLTSFPSVTIDNSIVANGQVGLNYPDLTTGASNVQVNFSLIRNTSGATFTGSNNLTGVDPQLGPLTNNGGPTQTYLPLNTSPVIDAGNPAFVSPPATDQRGLPRVNGGRIDMGAVEVNGGTIQFSQATFAAAEGTPTVTITVTRTGGTDPASVNYATSNGSAIAPGDYAATSGTINFPAGVTSMTFDVPIVDDSIYEGTETFNVTLSSPSSNATLGAQSASTVSIADNDPPPSLSINGLSQAESNSGTTPFNFVVTLTGATELPATVQYATADGTAVSPGDYGAMSGTLTFAPGVTSLPITVLVNGDTTYEADETFAVNLTSPVNASIAAGTGTGTIKNDDAPPTVSINSVAQAEGNSGTTAFTFTVTLSSASALPTTVQYATADGSAVVPGDYTATSGTLTFPPGVTTQSITVLVNGDTTAEPDETFTVNLTAPVNATIAAGTGTGTIQNDDGVPALSINSVAQNEGNSGTTAFTFTVTLSSASGLPATVQYATADGTAVAPGDYTATSGTLTFPPGVTTQPITVLVNGDTTYEANETFTVNLTAPVNATIAAGTGTGTVQNDDAPPALSINSVSQPEGNSGTTPFNFVVTLTGATELPVTVQYATADGTAVAPGDYAATSGTLTFLPGVTTQPITVPVNGDTTAEPDETFAVNLTAPVNATVAAGTGTGTIQNDDGVPTLSINNVSQNEGNSGTTSFTFTVTLSSASGLPATVQYTTADGTAVAPGDYAATSGTLTFPPGVTTQPITVLVNGDTTYEADETFTVNLTAPVNATVAAGTGTGTVRNDDAPPALSINSVSQAEGNSGTTPFNFVVTLTGATELPATVQYATANGTAVAPGDYAATSGTLTFSPGVTTQPITVLVNGDTTLETDETFTVTLSAPVNATVTAGTGTGTIRNDDAGTADVAITKTVSGSTFFAGQPITYDIAVTNAGPNDANAVVVTDVLPAGTTLVSVVPSQGSCSGTTTISCSIGPIANGGNATIHVTLIPSAPGPLSNTATVFAAPQLDPNPANGSSTATVTVKPAAAIPLFGAFTKILLALTTALAGLVMVKKQSS